MKPQYADDSPNAPTFEDMTTECGNGWCAVEEKDAMLSVIYASETIKV